MEGEKKEKWKHKRKRKKETIPSKNSLTHFVTRVCNARRKYEGSTSLCKTFQEGGKGRGFA